MSGECTACQLVVINGVRCHEHGCPEAWKGKKHSCTECGCEFTPETRFQVLCKGCLEDRPR
jgi:hypothetical protein